MKTKKKWEPIKFNRDSAEERKFRRKCSSPAFVAECLEQYQKWRKGEGEYDFDENDSCPQEQPFSPRALSIVEDCAIRLLKKYAKSEK